jgi:hypothetical protein
VRKAGERGTPLRATFKRLVARLELAALRAAVRRGDGEEKAFAEAFAVLRPLISKPDSDSRPYQMAAALHAERADWLTRRGRNAEEDLRDGLLRAGEALSKNPHNPEALFVQGWLHLQRARLARAPGAQAEEALRARESFDAALRENPQVARENPHLLKEVAALVR